MRAIIRWDTHLDVSPPIPTHSCCGRSPLGVVQLCIFIGSDDSVRPVGRTITNNVSGRIVWLHYNFEHFYFLSGFTGLRNSLMCTLHTDRRNTVRELE